METLLIDLSQTKLNFYNRMKGFSSIQGDIEGEPGTLRSTHLDHPKT